MRFRYSIILCLCLSCAGDKKTITEQNERDTLISNPVAREEIDTRADVTPHVEVYPETGNVSPDSLVAFAKTLLGIPYQYASTDPAKGFDCSGFITYVFNHFGIKVPRSSVDFTNYGRGLMRESAKPGDLILFTGTDSTVRIVGHMGIIVSNDEGRISFIHSSSGKAKGVVITPLGDYYMGRFVKVIRVFGEESF